MQDLIARPVHSAEQAKTATKSVMKYRPFILLATTTIVVAGYFVSIVSEDTLPKAADRFGKAILASNTVTLWGFVPEDERAFYGFDQRKFDAYWSKIIQPHLKDLKSYHVFATSATGLLVICEPAKVDETTPKFALLVTGQMGKYYSPYIVGYSSINCAALDLKVKKVSDYRRFSQYASWVKTNKAQLLEIGIPMIRRGPKFPGETLDKMRVHFEEIAASDKAGIKLASR